jgi:hypothetical protein
MKAFMVSLIVLFVATHGFAGVSYDKTKGQVKLDGVHADEMLELIKTVPVLLGTDSVTLNVYTDHIDFKGKKKTSFTGEITCSLVDSSCSVVGHTIKTAGDGWFSPSKGFVRVFGMGTLKTILQRAQNKPSFFTCQQVYENDACDFDTTL